MKTKSKRSLALLLISALLAGILPLSGSAPVQAAGYGLNNPKTDADGVTTWDCIWFGNYWQEDTNGDGKADKNDAKQPIKWRVLSVEGDDAFLLADKNIDVQRYNKNYTDVTWETCTMRSWLNGYGAEKNQPGEDFRTNNFLDNAFSVAEQSAIKTTNVVNNDNPEYEIEGGNDTSDKVYLLSIDEVTNPEYGFTSSTSSTDTREAVNTAYVADGGEIKSSSMKSAGSEDVWWLRSPGNYSSNAAYVIYGGYVNTHGYNVFHYYTAARPALHLNLSSLSSWSYAGTVTSEGGETGTVTPRPGSTLQPGTTEEPSQTDEPLFTWPPEPTATPKSPEAQAAENITAALPDLDDLGSAELKGPELNILGNRFNLFQTKIGMSLPVFNNTQINIDHKNHTAEVLLGLEGGADASVKADPDDTYWRESYQEVKSLVKACGGKVDTTKLWNRFSKLRGKLKKIDGEAAFKVSGNAAGYIKLELDENDKPVRLVEGGIMAGLEASGKVKTPLWWVFYSEFGVGGSVDGKLTLTTENTKTIQVQGELGLTIKPSISVGAGLEEAHIDAKGGLEGEIGGTVQIPWKSFEECVSAWLTGKLFIKGATPGPGLRGEWSYDLPRMELYPELGKIEKRNFVMEYERSGSPTREEVGEIRRYASGAVDGAEQSLVYENAKPEMVQLPDGRILMTYLDDTLQGAEGQAKLMYRLYEDGTWSSGKPVNANTNLDTAGKLCVYGGKAYVLYENSRQPITEQMTEKEILDSMDLYAASFDVSLNCFGTPVRLGEVSGKESSWKYGYDFVADGTSLKAVWAENSGGDVLLNSGNTVFYKSTLSGTEWEEKNEIRSVTGAVQEFCMWEEDGTVRLAYIKDGKLYMDGTFCDNITGKADSVKIFDGQMYFRLDGTLHRWENGSSVSLGTACTTSYRVLDDTVYWTEQDNFKSEIYKKEISVTGRPVAVTADGGYIGGFSLLKQQDGELLLSYTLQSVHDMTGEESPYGLTVLKSKEELSRNQAEVTGLAYDILSFVPGEDNDIAVNVANTGTTELTQVKVTISDASGNVLHEEVVSARMKPGEVLEKHLSVRIPKELAAGSIRASVSAGEPFASADQVSETLELETNAADLEITSVDADTVCITNLSDSPAEQIKLEVKDGDETGTLLQSGNIETLAAGEKKTISVAEAWKSSTVNTQTGDRYLHCEVTQKADEYTLWNNSIQLQKQGSRPQPSASAAPALTTSPTPPGEKTELSNPATNSSGVTTWDCIWFGNYWQEDTNGDGKADKNDAKQPIKWRVLSVDGDDAFLLADKNLDCQIYNDTCTDVTWETCTMRRWLNGYGTEVNKNGKDYSDNNFLNNAFSAAEQSAIKTTNVVNNYSTVSGKNTSDKVYLLSFDEVTNPEYGFNSSWSDYAESRRALNTAFAKEQGALTSTFEKYAGNGSWWLRSPGISSRNASYVSSNGNVITIGNYVDYNHAAARPALHLKLKASSDAIAASSWSYAGTVTSEGGEIPSPTEPGNTQKPQETTAPGTPFVAPSAPQPGTPVISAPGIPSASVKSTVGKVSSLKLKQKKRTVTASWKKLTGVKGYQICYSTSKKWKNKKLKLVTKNKAVIKNLKKKKTYYFRVRAYRLEGTKKVYGAWSNTKKIKIKK